MSTTENGLKTLHDLLLAQMPDGTHASGECLICAEEGATNHDTTPGGSMPETFTQDDIDAAIAAATSGLQQRLVELEAQVQDSEIGKAIASATAEKEAAIAELQSKLDTAEAAKTAAENKLVETEQYWANAIEEHEAAATFAARKEQRTTQAREAGVFSDDYITANSDRFAAYSDEDWAERLDEWALIAKQSGTAKASVNSGTPANTALRASRSDSGESKESSLALLSTLRAQRIDPRALGGAS